MSNHQAAGSAREAAIGYQGYGFPQASADNGACNGQHFTHARPTHRALVADDDHVAGRAGCWVSFAPGRLDAGCRAADIPGYVSVQLMQDTGRRRVISAIRCRAPWVPS